jgi:hypothetical protein
MSENGNGSSQAPAASSQTFSSFQESNPSASDSECIAKCNEIIEQYRRQENAKANSILALQEILLELSSIREGGSLPEALAVYISILNSIDRLVERARI